MVSLADELYTSTRDRLIDLKRLVDTLMGHLTSTATEEATRRALQIFMEYHDALSTELTQLDDVAADDDDRVKLCQFYLRDIGNRLGELEDWFCSGADSWVTPIPDDPEFDVDMCICGEEWPHKSGVSTKEKR